jgi:hypothetical protein
MSRSEANDPRPNEPQTREAAIEAHRLAAGQHDHAATKNEAADALLAGQRAADSRDDPRYRLAIEAQEEAYEQSMYARHLSEQAETRTGLGVALADEAADNAGDDDYTGAAEAHRKAAQHHRNRIAALAAPVEVPRETPTPQRPSRWLAIPRDSENDETGESIADLG